MDCLNTESQKVVRLIGAIIIAFLSYKLFWVKRMRGELFWNR